MNFLEGDLILKKRIAIIGANEAITTLINKAKDKGYETHVFAWQCGDPGESAADFFYPISIDEKEAILKICKRLNIIGICSITSDYAVETVNYVARKLGLISNPERTDIVARNKYKMRVALKEAGLYTPEFMIVDKDTDISLLHQLKFPIIVKPTDRWSSKGVTRIDNVDDLKDAIEFAISESFENKAVVEEFMDGLEYSAECICYRGYCKILAYTKKETTGFPHYIETGHMQPANLSQYDEEYINEQILKAVDALDIRNGAAHVEFKILDNGKVGIIEIGARMGGGCIGTHLTQISTGQDYVDMVIDIACGKAPNFRLQTKSIPVKIKFIMEKQDMDDLLKLKKNKMKNIIKISNIDEDFSRIVTDNNNRHGYYITLL